MGYGSIVTMPHRLPPGCIEDVDRHGNIRIYFRRKGAPKVRLREMPWTPAFMTEYEAAKGQATTPAAKGIKSGNVAMAVRQVLFRVQRIQVPFFYYAICAPLGVGRHLRRTYCFGFFKALSGYAPVQDEC